MLENSCNASSCHLAEGFTMNVDRRDRRIAIFRQTRFVESGDRDVSGARGIPQFSNPLMTPTAVRSFTAMTAVGRGDNFAMAESGCQSALETQISWRIGPGSNPKSRIHFSYASCRTAFDLRPTVRQQKQCADVRYREVFTICLTPEK